MGLTVINAMEKTGLVREVEHVKEIIFYRVARGSFSKKEGIFELRQVCRYLRKELPNRKSNVKNLRLIVFGLC